MTTRVSAAGVRAPVVMSRREPRPFLLALSARPVPVCTLGSDAPVEVPMPEPESGTWWEYVSGFGWVERRPVVEPVEVPQRESAVAA